LCDTFFLVSRLTQGSGGTRDANNRTGIFLVDVFGNEVLLHTEGPGCFNPNPLRPAGRPVSIPPRRDFQNAEGYVYVQDVYAGRHMRGRAARHDQVPARGGIAGETLLGARRLGRSRRASSGRQLAQLRNQTHPGHRARRSGRFGLFLRAVGYVPVLPVLDENGMMVQSMRSGTVVQSGETTGCIGCHDDRRTAPLLDGQAHAMPLALSKLPGTHEGWRGSTETFNYMTEVQPVFDQHCVSCHDFGKPAGDKLNLAADRNLIFNTSYNELWRKGFDPRGRRRACRDPARLLLGLARQSLVRVLRNEHDDHEPVELTRTISRAWSPGSI
jgi:hypothetical protein